MIDPVVSEFNEYSRTLDAETAREIYLETLEEQIKTDTEEKARLALLYAEAQGDQFFEWAAERLYDERTPQFEGGWSEC